jgi:hypothetical protein
MYLPIDTTNQNPTQSLPAKPVIDFNTKTQKLDENGEPVFVIQVVLYGEAGAEVVPVKFSGQPPLGLKPGASLRITGLVATTWSMEGGKHGVSFRAAKIEVVGAPAIKAAS